MEICIRSFPFLQKVTFYREPYENNLQHIMLNESLNDYDLRNKTLTARVRELEQLLLCSNAQIGAMQKLITGS